MKTSTKVLLGLSMIILFFTWSCNSSSNDIDAEYEKIEAENEKREVEEANERQRVESIIDEVNSLASIKDFDNALVKANSISWNLDPSWYVSNVEHYEKQKNEIIATITLLKTNQDSVFAVQEAQKARQEQSQQNLMLLKQQEEILTKQFNDSLNKINPK